MNRIAVVGGICCDISGKPYTDIIERMLQERGVDPWKDYIEEEKTEG